MARRHFYVLASTKLATQYHVEKEEGRDDPEENGVFLIVFERGDVALDFLAAKSLAGRRTRSRPVRYRPSALRSSELLRLLRKGPA